MGAKAVIFDLGGVVLDSPLEAIADYERRKGLPLISSTVSSREWAAMAPGRLETGKVSLEDFFEAFDAEAASCGAPISSRELMDEIARYARPRHAMIEAIRRLRRAGFRVAALTNNWVMQGPLAEGMNLLRAEFDVFVESSRTGLQKPDPRIYELALQELGVQPKESVFLDDIGRNLKTARQLGMATIKVSDPEAALAELEEIVGIPLRTAG